MLSAFIILVGFAVLCVVTGLWASNKRVERICDKLIYLSVVLTIIDFVTLMLVEINRR
jgi:hypothetical protein